MIKNTLIGGNIQISFVNHWRINSTNIITKDTIEKTGEDGAYFRTLETAKQTFGFDKDEENIYHLVVTFPKEYDSFEYQDIIEGVTICIESKQIIDKNA